MELEHEARSPFYCKYSVKVLQSLLLLLPRTPAAVSLVPGPVSLLPLELLQIEREVWEEADTEK